jgi:hypothetical protein
MCDKSSVSNFDNYIAELHDYLDRSREIADVDEQCSALIGDLAQAYSEQPSSMQTGRKTQSRSINRQSINFSFQPCVCRHCSRARRIF